MKQSSIVLDSLRATAPCCYACHGNASPRPFDQVPPAPVLSSPLLAPSRLGSPAVAHMKTRRQVSVRRRRTRRALVVCLIAAVTAALLWTALAHWRRDEWVVDGLSDLEPMYPARDTHLSHADLLPPMPAQHFDYIKLTSTGNETPLAFPSPYQGQWQAHPHLLVIAIQGSDDAPRRVMRDAQRRTWLRYPNVARKTNDFKGHLLVLYVQSVNKPQPPYVSDAMYEEMRLWGDTLTFPLTVPPRDGPVSPFFFSIYGEAFEVCSTRKTLLTFRYVYRTFPDTPFIAKSDDDTFINVPELMRSIRSLPRVSTLYGKTTGQIPFNYGMLHMVTRDVGWEVATDETVIRMSSGPYTKDLNELYSHYQFEAEDHMTGRSLFKMYGSRPRPRPVVPHLAPGLPGPEGWGAAYMAYMERPTELLSKGTAALADGAYSVSFDFGPPAEFQPERIVFVCDNCRFRHTAAKSGSSYGRVVQHRAYTVADHVRAAKIMRGYDAVGAMLRPRHIHLITEFGYEYLVRYCQDSNPLHGE